MRRPYRSERLVKRWFYCATFVFRVGIVLVILRCWWVVDHLSCIVLRLTEWNWLVFNNFLIFWLSERVLRFFKNILLWLSLIIKRNWLYRHRILELWVHDWRATLIVNNLFFVAWWTHLQGWNRGSERYRCSWHHVGTFTGPLLCEIHLSGFVDLKVSQCRWKVICQWYLLSNRNGLFFLWLHRNYILSLLNVRYLCFHLRLFNFKNNARLSFFQLRFYHLFNWRRLLWFRLLHRLFNLFRLLFRCLDCYSFLLLLFLVLLLLLLSHRLLFGIFVFRVIVVASV